jgi:hypothetical protein
MQMFRRRATNNDFASAEQIERLMILQSKLESSRRRDLAAPKAIKDLEYSVFSQFGDDGIIEYLASKIPEEFHTFVEFGIEDYKESNTRLLLQRDNWDGLVLDGAANNIKKIRTASYFWKYNLRTAEAFITRDNINDLLLSNGFQGTIGLLHIDIDGVDYWVWETIEAIQPLLVIVEYNSLFGSALPVSVPYRSDFLRSKAHFSNLYFGASVSAFEQLARKRDLVFVGCNMAGNNAFFVHSSIESGLPVQSVKDGYVKSKFREGRDLNGELILETAFASADLIAHLPLMNVITGEKLLVSDTLL